MIKFNKVFAIGVAITMVIFYVSGAVLNVRQLRKNKTDKEI
jgi:hypothetical protein